MELQVTTITPDYIALNRELHKKGYGSGGYRWADIVQGLKEETESETVLDYGCGKGTLGAALNHPDWLLEYDPAIEGKEEAVITVDLVVCTDVLEHIEPKFIDNVLKHLANLSKKVTYLVISTVSAEKTLSDGRNAHLIVENADWWREKLEKYFFISSWDVQSNEVIMIGSTIRIINDVIVKSAVSDNIRYEQAVMSCPKFDKRVVHVPRHDKRVVIVCFGPSLKHTWRTIKAEQIAFGATVVSVSGAHDFLIDKGIIPDIHIECDPREHKAFFTKNSRSDIKYWIASCCHPILFDQLEKENRDILLWHLFNSDKDADIIKPGGLDPGNFLISGAGTVGARAVNVMFIAGYRSFSIHGMDCSFEEDGEQHAGEHSGKKQIDWSMRAGERWFKTSGGLVYAAQGFIENMRSISKACLANEEPLISGTEQRIELFIHGDGLLAHMYKIGMEIYTEKEDG